MEAASLQRPDPFMPYRYGTCAWVSLQVYASGAAWTAARPSLETHVAATALGTMPLKGVRERMELWALRHVQQLQPGQLQEQEQ